MCSFEETGLFSRWKYDESVSSFVDVFGLVSSHFPVCILDG
jgi:hypothetical protein